MKIQQALDRMNLGKPLKWHEAWKPRLTGLRWGLP